MQPTALELEGFRSHRTCTRLDFTDREMMAIVGPNGAGKSSLFDALAFALAGRCRGPVDAVVAAGTDVARARVEFDASGNHWAVERQRVRGKKTAAWLYLDVDGTWVKQCGPGARDTDRAVADLLGMRIDTLEATALLTQGDAGRFAEAGPAERRTVLAEVIGLDRFDSLATRARRHAAELRGAAGRLQVEIDGLDVTLASFAGLQEQMAAARTEVEVLQWEMEAAAAAVEAAERRLTDADRARQHRDSLIAGREAARQAAATRAEHLRHQIHDLDIACRDADSRLQAAQANLARSTAAAAEAAAAAGEREALVGRAAEIAAALDRLVAQQTAAEADRNRIVGELADARARKEILAQRVDGLAVEGEACVVCEAALTEARRHDLHQAAVSEAASVSADVARLTQARKDADRAAGDLQSRIGRGERAAADVAAKLTALDRRLAELSAIAGQEAHARQAVDAAESDVTGGAERRSSCQDLLAAAQAEAAETVAAIDEQIRSAEQAVAAADKISLEHRSAVEALGRLQARRADLDSRVAVLADRITRADEVADQRDKLVGELDQTKTDERRAALVGTAFSPKGIPALLLEGAVGELEVEANEVLEEFANTQLRVELRTGSDDAGGMPDSLDVVVHGPHDSLPYEVLSGGERLRVDLALRLGLATALGRRRVQQIEMLLLDEPCAALDSRGVHDLIDALREMQQRCGFIAVITHDPEVAAAFPVRVEVDSTSGSSAITRTVR